MCSTIQLYVIQRPQYISENVYSRDISENQIQNLLHIYWGQQEGK